MRNFWLTWDENIFQFSDFTGSWKQSEIYCHAIIDSIWKQNNDSDSVVYTLVTVLVQPSYSNFVERICKIMKGFVKFLDSCENNSQQK